MKLLYKGFTLVEIIVVIGIISILAAIVIIAVNPARQFSKARNTQRVANVREIYHGVVQRISDDKGVFPSQITLLPKTIGTNASSDPNNFVDLSAYVSNYLASIPFDPSTGSPQDTKYVIFRNANNNIAVVAPNAELNQNIRLGTTNNSLDFDGVNDTVNIPDSVPLIPSSPFAMSIWAKKNGAGSAEPRGVIFAKDGNLLDTCMNGKVRMTLVIGGTPQFVEGGTCPTPGQWGHYAASFNGTTATLYQNGALVGTAAMSGSVTDGAGALRIGGDPTSGSYFNGAIGDVRVYNQALTAQNVLDIKNGFPVNTGLIGFWNFDEGSGITASDSSGNNQTGTLMDGNTVGNGTGFGPIWF